MIKRLFIIGLVLGVIGAGLAYQQGLRLPQDLRLSEGLRVLDNLRLPESLRVRLGSAPARPDAAPGRPAAAPGARPPAPVETATVRTGAVTDDVEALGTLIANESVSIAPEIAGRITAVRFKEGERVKQGATLIELDSTTLRAELAQAQADLRLAQDTFERARTLAQRGSGTQVALEQATAQLQVSQAKVALAEARLEKATLVAPFDGVVGLRSVSVGNYVPAGQALITLTSMDPIKVDFRVPELFLRSVKVGQQVELRVDALLDRSFTGEIYAIDPVVDVNGRAIKLRARIPNRDLVLKPGLFARITVVLDTRPNAVLVPEAALVPQGTEKFVYRVDNGQAKLTKVELGKRLPGRVEVRQGLEPGAVVVTAGQLKLRDGAPVEAVPAQAELKP